MGNTMITTIENGYISGGGGGGEFGQFPKKKTQQKQLKKKQLCKGSHGGKTEEVHSTVSRSYFELKKIIAQVITQPKIMPQKIARLPSKNN